MKKLLLFGATCFVIASIFFKTASIVHAETYLGQTSIFVDTLWDKEHSPYIIGGIVTVVGGSTLTIEAGVEVKGDLTIVDPLPALFIEGGSLVTKGKSGDSRVTIRDLDGIFITDSTADIGNTDISGPGGFVIDRSLVAISTTTISGAWSAMNIKESQVSIVDSQIKGNSRGIRIEPEGVPEFVSLQDVENVGGLGNIFEDEFPGKTAIKIFNSSIDNNSSYAIHNIGTSTVEAIGNWWGISGPIKTGENRIIGFVDYDPWINTEPEIVVKDEDMCCSSVLFIPGLEATRLYIDSKGVLGTSTNTLWEPNKNSDVRKLYLNTDGSSVEKNIYSGEPIGKALGVVGVYDEFIQFLDSLRNKGQITEWKAFGYDWRKPISEVVAGSGASMSQSSITESLIKVTEDLASRSPTGKIKIIAHSNGGLIAKYLVRVLAEMQKEDLVDSVISVAVPYLGTPEALLGLLHGDNQSILGGLIVNQAIMRGLAENMSSAYSLLPSEGFFSKILSPTIVFASTTIDGLNDGSYPSEVDSIEEQSAFVVDSQNVRLEPVFSDIDNPLKGNDNLLLAANILHGILDPFVWPSTIAHWTIVGWNVLTTQGLEYKEEESCKFKIFGSRCSSSIARSIVETLMGDGTVVVPSAIDQSFGSIVSLDLDNISQSENTDIVHRNILEASSTQIVITSIVTNDRSDNKQFSLPAGASWGEPESILEIGHDLVPELLVISTHSPVDLHVYDDQGNHTGLLEIPSELADNDFITGAYEQKIRGSKFRISGDGLDSDTYIHVPFVKNKIYSVAIKGKDFGTFTFKVEKLRGGKSIEKSEYSFLSVTPLTLASTTVGDIKVLPLQVDFDGNGSSDLVAIAGAEVDPYAGAIAAKNLVKTLLGSDRRAQQLIKRIDKLVEMAKKGKEIKAQNKASRLKWRLGHQKLKNISQNDRQQIIDILEELFD